MKHKMRLLTLTILTMLLLVGTAFAEDEIIIIPESMEFRGLASEGGTARPSLLAELPFNEDDLRYGIQLETADPLAWAVYCALEQGLSTTATQINIYLADLGMIYYYETHWEEILPRIGGGMLAYQYDHPESQYCSYSKIAPAINTGNGQIVYVTIQVTQISGDSAARRDAMTGAVEEFRAGFDAIFPDPTTASVVEQYRYIHDYICQLTEYNDEAVYDTAGHERGDYDEAHTAYGILVDYDPVVCEGYAKAYKVLCDSVGLPCILVVGEGGSRDTLKGEPNHMWNYVRVDGAWYGVDVTWDDVDGGKVSNAYYTDIEVGFTLYTYFMNNAYFDRTNEACRHFDYGITQTSAVTITSPTLASGTCPGAAQSTLSYLQLTLNSSDFSLATQFLNAGNWVGSIPLTSAPSVTIFLTQDCTVSSTMTVPADKQYAITGYLGDPYYAITYADGFTGSMFTLNGALVLDRVTVDGGSFDREHPVMVINETGYLYRMAGSEVYGFVDDASYQYSSSALPVQFYYQPTNRGDPIYIFSTQTVSATLFIACYDQGGKLLSIESLAVELSEDDALELTPAAPAQGTATWKFILLTQNVLSPLAEAVSVTP